MGREALRLPPLDHQSSGLGAPRGNGVNGLSVRVFLGQDQLDFSFLDLLESGQGIPILASRSEFNGSSWGLVLF